MQVSHTSMILSPPVDQLYRHYADGLLCQRFPIVKAKNKNHGALLARLIHEMFSARAMRLGGGRRRLQE